MLQQHFCEWSGPIVLFRKRPASHRRIVVIRLTSRKAGEPRAAGQSDQYYFFFGFLGGGMDVTLSEGMCFPAGPRSSSLSVSVDSPRESKSSSCPSLQVRPSEGCFTGGLSEGFETGSFM